MDLCELALRFLSYGLIGILILTTSSSKAAFYKVGFAVQDNLKNGQYENVVEDNSYPDVGKQTIDKRGPSVSINQDLVSIASMLRNEADLRRLQETTSFLHELGKRSRGEKFYPLYNIPSSAPAKQNQVYDKTLTFKKQPYLNRPARRLSVSFPLDSLSHLINDPRKLRQQTSLLQHIGKRAGSGYLV